jgi:hypothetical protein
MLNSPIWCWTCSSLGSQASRRARARQGELASIVRRVSVLGVGHYGRYPPTALERCRGVVHHVRQTSKHDGEVVVVSTEVCVIFTRTSAFTQSPLSLA